MKATNIEWDVDCPEDLETLPKEVVIPDGMKDEDEISDYLSDPDRLLPQRFLFGVIFLKGGRLCIGCRHHLHRCHSLFYHGCYFESARDGH